MAQQWIWQDGTAANDSVSVMARGSDGSLVLAGYTEGDWSGVNAGESDIAVMKLDADGELQWRWQYGTISDDYLSDVAMGDDGSTFLFLHDIYNPEYRVIKIDADGNFVWGSQVNDVYDNYNIFVSGVVRSDGSVFFAQTIYFQLNESYDTSWDFAGVLLSADGDELWRWQGETNSSDQVHGVALGEDDSVIISGHTWASLTAQSEVQSDLMVVKLDSDGNLLWSRQYFWSSGSLFHPPVVGGDGSVYFSGYAQNGTYYLDDDGLVQDNITSANVIVKLDADGEKLWRWQGVVSSDFVFPISFIVGADGSVNLAGTIYDYDLYGEGDYTFQQDNFTSAMMAVKLDADGEKLWRWQEDTSAQSWVSGAVLGDDGSLYLAGATQWDWTSTTADGPDFALTKLNSDGTTSLRWQGGTEAVDLLTSIVFGDDGEIIVGGLTAGDWGGPSAGGSDFVAFVMDDSAMEGDSSSTSTTSATPSSTTPSTTPHPSPSPSDTWSPVFNPSPTFETSAPVAPAQPTDVSQPTSPSPSTTMPATSSTSSPQTIAPTRSTSSSSSSIDQTVIISSAAAAAFIFVATAAICVYRTRGRARQ